VAATSINDVVITPLWWLYEVAFVVNVVRHAVPRQLPRGETANAVDVLVVDSRIEKKSDSSRK
jgi:hypothetical protein